MPLLIRALTPLRWRPLHREHFFLRPDELLWVPMTFETPLHIQRSDLIGQRHQIDPPVTGRTTDAFVHVNAVIEIDEVWKVVHSRPLDRLAGAPAFANRFEIRTVRPDLGMAIHASLSWRNARISKSLNGGMTIAAIDSVVSDVMFVAELNGLFAREISLGVVRGPVEFEQKPNDYRDEEDRAEDADFRYEVGASMKDLAHRLLSSRRELENCSRTRIGDCASSRQFHPAWKTECFDLSERSETWFTERCSTLFSWLEHYCLGAGI
jgi:hypothetical protein